MDFSKNLIFHNSYVLERIVLGVLFITLGIFLFIDSSPLIQMMAVASVLVGIFIVITAVGKNFFKNEIEFLIVFGMISWTIVTLFITFLQELNIEIFIILLFIGLLVIKEVFSEAMPSKLKNKLKMFILFFLVVFVLIILKKVMALAYM